MNCKESNEDELDKVELEEVQYWTGWFDSENLYNAYLLPLFLTFMIITCVAISGLVLVLFVFVSQSNQKKPRTQSQRNLRQNKQRGEMFSTAMNETQYTSATIVKFYPLKSR